jgi:hypothetical protein
MVEIIWGGFMNGYTNIKIPVGLYNRYKDMMINTEYKTVEDYMLYVLREEVAKYNMVEDGYELTEDEEEAIKVRLRALGYLD